MSSSARAPAQQQGFVMLAVIWVLLAMLAGVALFSHWVHGSLQHAQQRQQQINAQIAAQSVMNSVLYIRLVGQRSAYGVNVPDVQAAISEDDFMAMFDMDDMGGLIVNHEKMEQAQTFPFDNRPWRYGGLNFVAQDSAGLLGFTHFSHGYVAKNLLRKTDSNLREQQLLDSYLDYVDKDNQRRMSGAEAFDYRLAQRAEPLNGALRTPLQLRDVMHWDQVLQPWSNGDLLYRLRIAGGATVNLNSAAPEVLEMILLKPELANELYQRRRTQPFTTVFDPEALINDDAVGVMIQPAEGLRFWWWEQQSRSAWVYDFTYDGLIGGADALIQGWALRVDVPAPLRRQAPKIVEWNMLPAYPDYLGR